MGIPISKNQTQTWEHDGVKYTHRPVVGLVEDRVFEVMEAMAIDHKPYIGDATKEVDAEHKGESWKKGERTKAIIERASSMASVNSSLDLAEQKKTFAQFFDELVTGWDADVEFPTDDPSQCLQFRDLAAFFTHISRSMGLGDDDAKK